MVGSTLDSLLAEDGTLEEVTKIAKDRLQISIASTTAVGPNLYPHTTYHRGFPAPLPTETIISMACTLPQQEGPFVLGVEDLETIAASLIWQLPRPLSAVVLAQAEVIAEAVRHDTGLDVWRRGRRGMLGQAVRSIARCAANNELSIMHRRQQVYLWLHAMPIFIEEWQPEPVMAASCKHVTYVRGPLWFGWEYTPLACNHLGEYGVHPGARHLIRWKWWRRRPKLSVDETPEKMVKKLLDASSF